MKKAHHAHDPSHQPQGFRKSQLLGNSCVLCVHGQEKAGSLWQGDVIYGQEKETF